MTKREAIANHRKMWRWIADETEKQKDFICKHNYFDEMGIRYPERPSRDCYCCEYAASCKDCPIDWLSDCDRYMCCDKSVNNDNAGLFREWERCFLYGDWREAAALARQIAELPERKMPV